MAESYFDATADETKVLVKAGRTVLRGLIYENTHTAETYLQIHDHSATGDVTLGGDAPELSIPLRPEASYVPLFDRQMANGIVVAVTSTATGSAAPTATAILTLVYG